MDYSLLKKQLCVTGSIGSGKSRVARFLAELLHYSYVNIDDIARVIMNRGGAGLKAVSDYDPAFINSEGLLDRSLLRTVIFNSPDTRKDIDALLHPIIQSALLERLQGREVNSVIEIPLLFETGWDVLFDIIIVVYADKKTCLDRIVSRDKVTLGEAEKIHDSQMDPMMKKAGAHFVINNDGDWSVTAADIEDMALKLRH